MSTWNFLDRHRIMLGAVCVLSWIGMLVGFFMSPILFICVTPVSALITIWTTAWVVELNSYGGWRPNRRKEQDD